MRVGIVAAEPSGDRLAAGLMAALRRQCPEVCFEGIGGPLMQREGMDGWWPMETLSVMGFAEVLARLPELLHIRADLIRRWQRRPPDVFIGVDAPDFNLHLEAVLRRTGVPTIHYVCPTVWAWRSKRLEKLRRAADRILCIFPFEEAFLRRHGIQAHYVGHPLAQSYPLEPDRAAARQHLGISRRAPVLAVLPGSRRSEVKRLSKPFLQTAKACACELPELITLTPLATEATRRLFVAQQRRIAPGLPIELLDDTALALTAADVVLVASGTATLEALLCKRPMIVGYKLHPLTYHLIKQFKMLKIPYVAMANLLSRQPYALEFLQGACRVERLYPAVMHYFRHPEAIAPIVDEYMHTHRVLCMNSDERAAQQVFELYQEQR